MIEDFLQPRTNAPTISPLHVVTPLQERRDSILRMQVCFRSLSEQQLIDMPFHQQRNADLNSEIDQLLARYQDLQQNRAALEQLKESAERTSRSASNVTSSASLVN